MNELGAVWGAKERLMMLADNIGQLTAAPTRTNAMRMWATLVFYLNFKSTAVAQS